MNAQNYNIDVYYSVIWIPYKSSYNKWANCSFINPFNYKILRISFLDHSNRNILGKLTIFHLIKPKKYR